MPASVFNTDDAAPGVAWWVRLPCAPASRSGCAETCDDASEAIVRTREPAPIDAAAGTTTATAPGPSTPPDTRRRRRRRLDRADAAFLALCGVSAVVLLLLARQLTFWWDEWDWIWNRALSLESLMAPYNQHWLLGHLVIYESLLSIVGLTTYVPYMAVLIGFHVAAAWGLYRLSRRAVGGPMAIALGSVLLLYGNGHQDLLWAANIMFVAASAIGLLCLDLVLRDERPSRPRLLAVLLVVLVTLGGVGLLYLGTVVIALASGPGRRAGWRLVLPAIATWSVWWFIWGRQGPGAAPLAPGFVVGAVRGVWSGTTAAAGHLVGGPWWMGALLLAGLGLLSLWAIRRRRGVPPLLAVGISGFVGVFALVGLTRSEGDVLLSRHQYIAMVFLVLTIAALVGELLAAGAARRWLTVAVWGLAIVSVGFNARVLVEQRAWYLARADGIRAWADLMLTYGGSPALPEDRQPGDVTDDLGLLTVGTPADARAIITRYGSPLHDAVWGDRPIPDVQLDGVLFRLVRDQVRPTPLASMPAGMSPPALRAAADATVAVADACLVVRPDGPRPNVTVAVPGGSQLILGATADGATRIHMGLRGAFADRFQMNWTTREAYLDVPIAAGASVALPMPDLGTGDPWLVRVDPAIDGESTICMAPAATTTP